MAYVETRHWDHATWSPAQIKINGELCEVASTYCLMLVSENDDSAALVLSKALPDNVQRSDIWKALLAADPTDGIDFGELLRRCRQTMGERCGAITICGYPFDAHRLLDLGAALPYEGGSVHWAYHTLGMAVFVGRHWRSALMMCKAPNGTGNHIPILP